MSTKPTPEDIGALVTYALTELSAEEVAAIIDGRFMITPRPSRAAAEDLNATVAQPGRAQPFEWNMKPLEEQYQMLARAFSRYTQLNIPPVDQFMARVAPLPTGAIGYALSPRIVRLAPPPSKPGSGYAAALDVLFNMLVHYRLVPKEVMPEYAGMTCQPDARMTEFRRKLEYAAPYDLAAFPVWAQNAARQTLTAPNLLPLDLYSVGFILLTHQGILGTMPGFTVSTSDRYMASDQGDEGFANVRWSRGLIQIYPSRVSQAVDERVITFFAQE